MFNQTKKPRLSYGIAEDWERINDLLPAIGENLSSIESYDSFASVCRSWRAAVNTDHRRQRTFEHPCLMLPETEQGVREILRISSGNSRKIFLPEASGKRCLSWRDWLFVVAEDGIHTSLLHSVSRDHIHLPELPDPYSIKKVVLSAIPTTTSKFVIAAMLGGPTLGICIPGYISWIIVKWNTEISDIVCFNDRFYAVDYKGRFLIVRRFRLFRICSLQFGRIMQFGRVIFHKFYLADVSNKLFVVRRDMVDIEEHYGTKGFKIYEVNLKEDDPGAIDYYSYSSFPVETKDCLWNKALFLGNDSSFPVDCADYNHCKPNCIYFVGCSMDYYLSGYNFVLGKPGNDMGIYHISDGSIEPLFDGIVCNNATPPTWIGPGF